MAVFRPFAEMNIGPIGVLITEVVRLNPEFTNSPPEKWHWNKDLNLERRYYADLCKAGLK